MKKMISAALCCIVLLSMLSAWGFAEENITVTLNGEEVLFDTEPMIKNDRVFLPVRTVCEALGADVYWLESDRVVWIVKNDIKFYLSLDSSWMNLVQCADFEELSKMIEDKVDDEISDVFENISLDAAPFLHNGRTYLPIRAVCEALGAMVEWNGERREIAIVCDEKKMEEKNKDTDFVDKFEKLIEEIRLKSIKVYNRKGVITVTCNPEKSTDVEGFINYFFMRTNEINGTVYHPKEGNQHRIDIEYTEEVNPQQEIEKFLDFAQIEVTLRDESGNIVFGMEDFDEVDSNFPQGGFHVKISNADADFSVPLDMYIDEDLIGRCTVSGEEEKTISAYMEENKKYYLFAVKMVFQKELEGIEDIRFEETETEQHEETLVAGGMYGLVIDMEIARELANQAKMYFGAVTLAGYGETAFENGNADILIKNGEILKYLSPQYRILLIGFQNGSLIYNVIFHAEDEELYQRIKAAAAVSDELREVSEEELFTRVMVRESLLDETVRELVENRFGTEITICPIPVSRYEEQLNLLIAAGENFILVDDKRNGNQKYFQELIQEEGELSENLSYYYIRQ